MRIMLMGGSRLNRKEIRGDWTRDYRITLLVRYDLNLVSKTDQEPRNGNAN